MHTPSPVYVKEPQVCENPCVNQNLPTSKQTLSILLFVHDQMILLSLLDLKVQ